jgi:transcriptional regulator with XRE-family HTH domain
MNRIFSREEKGISELRRFRKERGISQERLAVLSGVSAQTIQQTEVGKREPHDSTLAKLAEVLETSVSELRGEDPVDWFESYLGLQAQGLDQLVVIIEQVSDLLSTEKGFRKLTIPEQRWRVDYMRRFATIALDSARAAAEDAHKAHAIETGEKTE